MKPADLFELPFVADPRVSPDGSTVAFTLWTTDLSRDSYASAIWLVASDGSREPTRLAGGSSPRWSPHGRSIAFVSGSQLHVVDRAGGDARRLTELPGGAWSPAWSPDGERIAFCSAGEPSTGPGDPRRLTELGYRADGAGWTDRAVRVHAVSAAGGAVERLTDGPHDADPCWSPDGASLAFVSDRDGGPHVHAPDALTTGDAAHASPVWSADGRTIVCRRVPDTGSPPRNAQVVTVDACTGDARNLTEGLDRHVESAPIVWQGSEVLCLVQDRGWQHVYAGTRPVVGGDRFVAWFDARGGVLVHTENTAMQPTELYRGDVRLTRFTEAFVRSTELRPAERFTAGDVDAWLIRPRGAGPHPVVVYVHGGPFGQYDEGFFDEFQIVAGAGYAVLYCNPRGSSGREESWARAIRGPYDGGPGCGTLDLSDILAVLDEALTRFGDLDPRRVAITGGSYGGYMSAWAISQTDRFAAAVAERGFYDLLSIVGTSDQPATWAAYMGGLPYDDPMPALRLSPVTFASRIRTPILLIAFPDDLRCPFSQSEELFSAIRLSGGTAELLCIPGSHGMPREGPPRLRLARLDAILGWFDRYLR